MMTMVKGRKGGCRKLADDDDDNEDDGDNHDYEDNCEDGCAQCNITDLNM